MASDLTVISGSVKHLLSDVTVFLEAGFFWFHAATENGGRKVVLILPEDAVDRIEETVEVEGHTFDLVDQA